MERYNKIIEQPLFKKAINTINEKELQRIFCKHGLDHSLDVARIAYILTLENNIDINKDIIYAAALLHDIGRAFEDKDHNQKSAELSAEILTLCGYTYDEISEVTTAILNHRKDVDVLNSLSSVISKADKLSRQCHNCKAYNECYWSDERRNKYIKY